MTTLELPGRSRAARAPRLALVLLLAGAVGIAFSPIFVRLSEVGPTATAFWRLGLAIPLLLAWVAIEKRPAPPSMAKRGASWALLLAGLCFAGDLAFWHWSLRFTSVANSTLLANFAPLFVTLGAWALWRERPSAKFLLGLAAALGGAVMLVAGGVSAGHVEAGQRGAGDQLFGDLLGIVTAIFYGGYMLAAKRARAFYSTAVVMSLTGIISAAVLLPMTLLAGETLFPPTLHGWAMLIGLAWIGQVAGQSLIASALKDLPASFSSVSLLLQPVCAALFAWLLLAEPMGVVQILGGLVVLAGIVTAGRASKLGA